MEQNSRMISSEFDNLYQQETTVKDAPLEDIAPNRRLAGHLLYLTVTRSDISYSIQHLSQFMHKPKQSHFEAARRIVRYVNSSPWQGIFSICIEYL